MKHGKHGARGMKEAGWGAYRWSTENRREGEMMSSYDHNFGTVYGHVWPCVLSPS